MSKIFLNLPDSTIPEVLISHKNKLRFNLAIPVTPMTLVPHIVSPGYMNTTIRRRIYPPFQNVKSAYRIPSKMQTRS